MIECRSPHGENVYEGTLTAEAIGRRQLFICVTGLAIIWLFVLGVSAFASMKDAWAISHTWLVVQGGALSLLVVFLSWHMRYGLERAKVRITPTGVSLSSDGKNWRELQFSDRLVVREVLDRDGVLCEIRVKEIPGRKEIYIRGFDMREIAERLRAAGVSHEVTTTEKTVWIPNLSRRKGLVAILLLALVPAVGLIYRDRITLAFLWLFFVAGASLTMIFWSDRDLHGKKEAYIWGVWTLLFTAGGAAIVFWLARYGVTFP
jgi:hypothetical protein